MTGSWKSLALAAAMGLLAWACMADSAEQKGPTAAPGAVEDSRSGTGGGPDERDRRPSGRVTFPSGRQFFADLAITTDEHMRGYMGRREILPDEGLLFINKREAVRQFWMKNCLVPIDIIWLDRADTVVAIEHSAPPCRQDPCPSFGPLVPTLDVFEVAGGIAKEEGLGPGDRLTIVTDHERR